MKKLQRSMQDHFFFTRYVDTTLPGLDILPDLCREGKYDEARHVFADFVRRRAQPEKYLALSVDSGEYFANIVNFEGESEMDMAERLCRKIHVSAGTPIDFSGGYAWGANPTFNQYNEWPWILNRHNDFVSVAYAYSQTGDEKYTQCFLDMFESWVMQATPVPDHTDDGDSFGWRTIESGIRMSQTWPYTFFTFLKSPLIDDNFIVEWYKSLWEHGKRLFLDCSNGNWILMETAGLGILGILFTELRDSSIWRDYAIKRMLIELRKQIYPDGFQIELTTNYHEVCINNCMRLVRVADAYGVELPEEYRQIVERGTDLIVKLMMPNGYLPDLNDGACTLASDHLKKRADYFPERKDFLWVATEGREGEEPAFKSVALPYSGQMIFRSGWERDAVYAHFDAGPFGYGHHHEDKLSLIMCVNGQYVLTEGGDYAYDNSPMRRYVSHTRAHNTIMVNGFGQNRFKNFLWHDADVKKLSDMEYKLDDACDYACGVYDEGYGPELFPAVHRRGVAFLKQVGHGLQPFVVVFDHVEADEAFSFESLWHLDDETFSMRNLSASTSGLTIMADGEGLSMEAVRGQEGEEWQGFIGTGWSQGNYRPIYALRYTGRAQKADIVTLLYPQGADCPVEKVCAKEPGVAELTLKDGTNLTIREADMKD